MEEAIIKDEVIEEEFEVKQEEIEQKPEYLLEKEIKTEPIDSFENNKSDEEFFEDVKLKTKENYSKIEKVSKKVRTLRCEICQKMMSRTLLKMITMKEDKTVLSENFEIKGSLEKEKFLVCLSHIQKIIDDNDGRIQISEYIMRSFISRNKCLIRNRNSKSRRKICKVCHMSKDRSELYHISSKNVRIVLMIGCILRGTHSLKQVKSYITNVNAATCYSHRKESIEIIFEQFKFENKPEIIQCPVMGGLMDIVKKFDPNLTVDQFIRAFNKLSMKGPKF
ncbi:unnamed protein product [Caenorhabditis nigoni]|nr:hypothetical protein B9Z55_021082 [Caenorhabditis nigoni]